MSTKPRIEPILESDWTPETRELLEGMRREGQVFNIFSTLARHPKLLRKWLVFAGHILGGSSLPPRDREIAILRIGWLCRAEYEWGHHVAIARTVGLDDAQIRQFTIGPDADDLQPFDAAILRAVDELNSNNRISDTTWSVLAEAYNTEQLMDFVFTVGQYKLVSMALNTLGIQLESGFERLPQ